MEQAKPVLLEPIMNVEVTVPEAFMGDIMGDLNSRRGASREWIRPGRCRKSGPRCPCGDV